VGGILLGLVLATGLLLVVVARRRQQAALRLEAAQAIAEAAVGTPFVPVRSLAPSPPLEGDENIPRWRRPSVAAARYETDNVRAIRAAEPAAMLRARPPRVFAEPTDVLGERMAVRYGVPLLNRPDEAFGRALENLASDDQVEILDRGDIWANVITPSGAAGWVPTATLSPTAGKGDPDDEEPALALASGASPQAVEPPSLEMLFEASRRAREEAAREPVSRPVVRAARGKPAAGGRHDDGPADGAGAPEDDGRRARARRRPKVRSATRQA
jgi:hypothetical protein